MSNFHRTLAEAKFRFKFSNILRPFSQSSRQPNPCQVTEEPDFYQAGGFHRVSLGDSFNSDQYTVMRKLGYGQYSTVWLARDTR
ncbi:uncharacterized protein ASPGLDRAFT_45622 [Aspergillus glaucus CBS 516.65]|uniref:non-specific serine/threonine protein kinase n=1 Tax=Aspergillus glaucus CBS 516.65 TaxID=1160497 RepID=A0A1L9VNX0_ASPGL|nr:hypothetical protein ASPGLDRAFT_45622 [Aspergillus glaucus CBS 516.65]OJJ85628.1 hypothetical protein ASPGLDRAFT_45622 [Aspergillus glaucus CBS 516.65]